MAKLSVQDLTYTYRESGQRVLALSEVNFTIQAGEFVSLIGPSGCGKSTLLKIIAGLIQPDHGSISLNDALSIRRAGRVAYMPQADALLPWRTILDNVILGAEIQGTGRNRAKQRARELFPLFGLEGFARSFPAQLSGGMRQRAAFLRTFLMGQDILLLDEPFGALDALTRRELQQWLISIWERFRYTVLLVTHDVEEAVFLSDRVLVMSARPAHILKEVVIPFPHPRQEHVEQFSPPMVALEKELLTILRG